MDQELGQLIPIDDLRSVWPSEASDFTPWLARAENLEALGSAIGIELELEAQEKNVGPFRADILCKNTRDSSWVLIENQLERTDHTHLGQILTYAAGLQAVTIVWVAKSFTEEHRATLDWLNDITEQDFGFFGLEVELWQIGDSPKAPKFNVACKPNDWSRSVSKVATHLKEGPVTETQELQFDFWSQFNGFLDRENYSITLRKPAPQNWQYYGIGRTGFALAAFCNPRDRWIGTSLVLQDDNAKAYFNLLKEEKERIEQELGNKLDWRELPGAKESRIHFDNRDMDPKNREQWNNQHKWLADALTKMDQVFRERIKTLNADDWHQEI